VHPLQAALWEPHLQDLYGIVFNNSKVVDVLGLNASQKRTNASRIDLNPQEI
jgi:hypothetical protein